MSQLKEIPRGSLGQHHLSRIIMELDRTATFNAHRRDKFQTEVFLHRTSTQLRQANAASVHEVDRVDKQIYAAR